MSEDCIGFQTPSVSGDLQALGGMLGPVRFTLADGREISPFAEATWSVDEARKAKAPPILYHLIGEWPCVPFGMPRAPADLPSDWQPGRKNKGQEAFPHGHGSNHRWNLMAESQASLMAAIGYPSGHPVRWLERRVEAAMDRPALSLSLTIHARQDVALPIGLHPVFRLPDTPGAARLSFAGAEPKVWTYPIPAEPGRSRLAPDIRGADPASVPASAGGIIDIRALPFEAPSEDLALVTGTGGEVTLDNFAEGYRVRLIWDAAALPACMLWLSNNGRRHAPWNGGFRAIGIEPIAAAFDLGVAASQNPDNPLARSGVATSVMLKAGKPWTTRYQIVCDVL